MTFDEWWSMQGLLLNLGRDFTVLDLKEIAKRAWDIASQQDDSAEAQKYCDFSDYKGSICPKCNNTRLRKASLN